MIHLETAFVFCRVIKNTNMVAHGVHWLTQARHFQKDTMMCFFQQKKPKKHFQHFGHHK